MTTSPNSTSFPGYSWPVANVLPTPSSTRYLLMRKDACLNDQKNRWLSPRMGSFARIQQFASLLTDCAALHSKNAVLHRSSGFLFCSLILGPPSYSLISCIHIQVQKDQPRGRPEYGFNKDQSHPRCASAEQRQCFVFTQVHPGCPVPFNALAGANHVDSHWITMCHHSFRTCSGSSTQRLR